MPCRSSSILLAAIALFSCATPPLAVSQELVANTTDGEEITGELAAWDTNQLSLTKDGQTRDLPVQQLLGVRRAEPAERPTELSAYVEFVDGSKLPIRDFAVSNHKATIDTPLSNEPLAISTDSVKLVQFSPRAREDAAFWTDLAQGRLSDDTLVVQQNDEGQVEHLSGVLAEISAERVQFNWDGEDVPVKRTKVVALAYYHGKPPQLPDPALQVTTASGARLQIAEVNWNAADAKVYVTTTGGVKLAIPVADLIEADFSLGKLTYLSDLQPLKIEWTPRIALPATAELIRDFGLPRRDQSFAGSSLTLSWPKEGVSGPSEIKNYAKGLALRSRTVAEYRIPADMTRFLAIAGVDPTTANQGNVSLEISADDHILWQGEIDGGTAPVEIDVPLKRARRLRLVVDYGGNLDYGDRLHLVDARLTK